LQGYVLAGLVLGSIYAISALGLVLTYSSSRIVNLAHGATAYTVAVFYHWLNHEQGWSIPAAAVVSLLVFSPLLGLALWAVLFRRLTHAPASIRFLATVGLWVALPVGVRLVFPFSQGEIFQPQGLDKLPVDIFHLSALGVSINGNQLAVLIGGVAVVVGLSVLLRATPIGLATRASVDSPRSAGLSGINTTMVNAGSWMLGTALAGLAGILLAPILGLTDVQFTLLLVASFAAAVVGRLTSLPLTFAGAMLIGLIQGVSVDVLPSHGILASGFRPSVPFIVMLVFLLAYQGLGREHFEIDLRASGPDHEPPPVAAPHGWRAVVGPLAAVVVLFSVPLWLSSFWVGVASQGVALAILFLTFTIVTGEGGMLSLCQATLAGVGGFATAALATHSTIFGYQVPNPFSSSAGWPLGLAILAGALLAVPVGLLVAALSLRLGDIYLALATLAFALLVEQLVFARQEFDNFGAGVSVNRPDFLGVNFDINHPTSFFLLLAGVFLVVAWLTVNLRRATTGLVMASMRSSEQAASTIGVNVVRSKLVAFGVSAFVAGLGGALFAVTIGRATSMSFNVLVGIVWLAIVVTWGIRSVLGALIAGLTFAIVPQLFNQYLPSGWHEVPTLLFGLGAIGMARQPRGILYDLMTGLRRLRSRLAPAAPTPQLDEPAAT
jgi:branched-chain amino acid transport system permease protein